MRLLKTVLIKKFLRGYIMILKDNEVILRAIEESEAELLRDMINNPEMENMVVGWSFPVSKAEQIRWIQEQSKDTRSKRYIVDVNGDGVGMASLTDIDYKNSVCVINIKLMDSAKGKGIGYRVIMLLLNYCFNELNLHCVTSSVLEYNIPSQKLFEKCDFKKDGVLRKRVYKNGKYHDLFEYSMLKEEFNAEKL